MYEFLQKTILQNILLLWNSKEVLSQITGLMLHGNHHAIVGSFPDVCYLIKLFVNIFALWEHLGRGSNKSLVLDFFANGTALLVKRGVLGKYFSSLWDNWEITKSSYNISGKGDNVVKSNDDIVERRRRDLKNNDNVNN